MRNHYWTCSKFADWLRGTTKGGAKTSEGWDEWEKRAKADTLFDGGLPKKDLTMYKR